MRTTVLFWLLGAACIYEAFTFTEHPVAASITFGFWVSLAVDRYWHALR